MLAAEGGGKGGEKKKKEDSLLNRNLISFRQYCAVPSGLSRGELMEAASASAQNGVNQGFVGESFPLFGGLQVPGVRWSLSSDQLERGGVQ